MLHRLSRLRIAARRPGPDVQPIRRWRGRSSAGRRRGARPRRGAAAPSSLVTSEQEPGKRHRFREI